MNPRIILLTASWLCSSALPAAGIRHQKPNVIYIVMDDLGYGDLGCYGQKRIETPHIDRLRAEGMCFTQHYSGSPVSAPSRCVLLTGLHSGHAQIRGNDEMAERGAIMNYDSMYVHPELEGQYPLRAGSPTLGRLMQQAGYVTGCFGKWGLGYPGSEGTPDKQGFDYFFGFNCQRQAHTHYPAFLWKDNRRVKLDNGIQDPHRSPLHTDRYDNSGYASYTRKEYAHDRIFNELMRFVRHHRKHPFFLMWTTTLPHVSLQAPRRWVDYYVSKFGDEEPYTGQSDYLPCRYPHATYAAMISYFDEQVGMLVSALKRYGLYEHTLIVLTSDNGPTFNGGTDSPWFDSGGPFKSEYGWGKCFLHEGGIRVPAIFTWPEKIKAGSTSDHVSAFQDVMPTLADLTGTPCPATDGISFLPTLLGVDSLQRQHAYLYWEYPEGTGQKAVRWGKWKAILTNIRQSAGTLHLYNLEQDLQEQHDVAKDYPDVAARMRAFMEESHEPSENPHFNM